MMRSHSVGTEFVTDLPGCGYFKVDADRKLISCNQYALDLLSCDALDNISGQSIEDLFSFATRIFLNSYTFPMLLNEGKVEEVQLSLKSMSGKAVPIVANVQVNVDETTIWTFMSCFNRDQLYNELLSARDTLQAQALSLSQLNEQAQERQSDLQAFCHSLSHDFTGPLRRVNQMIEYALEDLIADGVQADEAFKLLHSAQKNADTLLEMTAGLVEYLVADVQVSQNDVVALEDVVSSVLDMREQSDMTNLKVVRESLPTLLGNRAQIQVLFKNLIDNAIKYNENEPVINISHTEDIVNGRAVVAVQDNGIGMADAYIDRIFTPFTRLNSTDKYKGSGLGLSIVKKMVANHNGDIRVKSELGRGSTFYISLPVNASPSNDS